MAADENEASLLEILRATHLFQGADEEALKIISSQMKSVTYKKGDPIILENEVSDQVYFIKSGAIEITKYRPELQQVVRVAMLKSGAHFSEFSVLNKSNKSASAFAFEDSEIYEMQGDIFLKILTKFPALAQNLSLTLAELNSNFSHKHSYIEYFDSSSIVVNSEIPNLFPQNLWKKLGVLPLRYYANSILFAVKDPKQTEFSEYCRKQLSKVQINVVLIGDQDFEQAYKKLKALYASGSVSKGEKISETAVNEDLGTALRKSRYFQFLQPQAIEQLMNVAETVTYQIGEIIYSPGEESETFYLIQSGVVELSMPIQLGPRSNYSQIISVGEKESLAEVSLLLGQKHAHMARASRPSTLIKFNKNVFLQLLKSGAFCLNLSKLLARRLEFVTNHSGLKFNDGQEPPKMQEALRLLSKDIMLQHQLLPLKITENEITLGVVNPNSEQISSVVARYLRGCRINLEVITLENFKKWTLQAEPTVASNGSGSPSLSKEERSNVFDLTRVLTEGYNSRASDVHFEPSFDGYCIRYRIDGVMMEIANKIPKDVGNELVSRVKVLSQMDIANHLIPQDGQLKLASGDIQITARVSTVPTKHGENAVLRLIRDRNSTQPLSALVPDVYSIKILKSIVHAKQGLFLITGPTGSGKTTTLYSLISELNHVDVKIISIEDPVELEIPGTTQIEINEKSGMSFAKALKSTLRQDPDVVMVGEIRDEESAKIVFDAAMSGHLVISTLHTNSSFGVRNRLHELGIPSEILATGLLGAMAQRLVRALCKKCSRLRPTTQLEKEFLTKRMSQMHIPNELREPVGCSACNETGFHGRIPIIEIWKKTQTLEEIIATNGKTEDLIAAAKIVGFMNIEDFGLKMALCGLTTIDEAQRVTAGYT